MSVDHGAFQVTKVPNRGFLGCFTRLLLALCFSIGKQSRSTMPTDKP